jgi:hypothetical protein
MSTLLIGYDLNAPGKDYAELHAAIKAQGTAWWHHLDSTWLVRTERTPAEVRSNLKEHLDANDELIVIDVSRRSRAWSGFNARGSAWLRDTYS